jgi:disulfide bond formation protein DsbB
VRDTDLAITFFTFLTLLANAATLGIAGTAAARLAGRPAPRRAWARLHDEVAGGAVGLAWLVAAVAMSGSLYFSEVAGFTPCRLCWAQRACMYPLVVLLAVAGLTRRPAWRALGLALATVGAGIAVYHVLVERFPSLESGTCDPANPCSVVWFERFGFVTLPYMALSGFALIGTLLLTVGLRSPASTDAPRHTTAVGPTTTTTTPPTPRPEPTGTGRRPSAATSAGAAGTVGTSSAPSTSSTSTSSSVPVSGPAASPGRAVDATLLQENRS